jgi:hypothetical protein
MNFLGLDLLPIISPEDTIFAAFERALHWVVLSVRILSVNRFDHHFLYIATASIGVIVHIIFCLVDTLGLPRTGFVMIGVSRMARVPWLGLPGIALCQALLNQNSRNPHRVDNQNQSKITLYHLFNSPQYDEAMRSIPMP